MDYYDIRSEKEEKALEKFQEVTEDLKVEKNTLLRFLRAREHDVRKADEMLRKSLKWRLDHDLSAYENTEVPKYLKDDFVYEFSGHDNDGRPVLWLPLGKWNARTWLEKGLKDDIINFSYHMFHKAEKVLESSGRSQFILIIALEELTYWKVAHLESLQCLYNSLKELEANFPEILKTLFIVNAPWIFHMGYSFVKPIFTKHTQSKFRMYDTNVNAWMPALLEIMPRDSIPSAYKDPSPQS